MSTVFRNGSGAVFEQILKAEAVFEQILKAGAAYLNRS